MQNQHQSVMKEVQPCEVIAIIDDLVCGHVKTARPFVDKVRRTGVEGIKLIACSPENYASRRLLERVYSGKTYRECLEKLRLTPEVLTEIRAATDGLQLIVAPYDTESLQTLTSDQVDAWQIDPACNTNIELLESLAAREGRICFCTWGCSTHEIRNALSIFDKVETVLIHTLRTSSPQDLLNDMATLRWIKSLGYPIGCYDDSLDPYPSCLGLAMGARIIEKPLWVEIEEAEPPFSFKKLAGFVKNLRATERVTQSGPSLVYRPEEIDGIEDQRTGLVAAHSICQGTLLTSEMLAIKAPATGLSSELLSFVLGRRALYDIGEGEPITFGVIT